MPVLAPSPTDHAFMSSIFPRYEPTANTESKEVNLTVEGYTHYHRPQSSSSSSAWASTVSSPTTTASLVASTPTAETPSTSPETPLSTDSITYPSLALRMNDGPIPSSELRAPSLNTTRKPRNLKNLAVNTSNNPHLGRAVLSATLPVSSSGMETTSAAAPMTSAFVRPSQPTRRKTGNMGLTLKTPGLEQPTGTLETIDSAVPEVPEVPPMPPVTRPSTLRQIRSSPPPPKTETRSKPEEQEAPPPLGIPLPPPASANVVEVDEPFNFDIPQSREEKPEAYPDGPICIYDPHVYLYFEPTAKEASLYDVIFNVASEVKNPFTAAAPRPPHTSLRAVADALHEISSQEATPEPSQQANLAAELSHLKYIHVPWEHNTDIVHDLYDLVQVVDYYVQEGKRVLIHCQCGVSRSASLIVAYGLYKNPKLTVQDAYDAVKRRSKWIGPNMNLIMQLQEFRTGLLRGSSYKQLLDPAAFTPASLASRHATAVPLSGESDSSAPRTAPMRESSRRIPAPITIDNTQTLTPGPSSAPSQYRPRDDDPCGSPNSVPESPRAAEFAMTPVVQVADDDSFGLSSPLRTNFDPASMQGLALRQTHEHHFQSLNMQSLGISEPPKPSASAPPAAISPVVPPPSQQDDLEDTLLSPRATEFTRNPFHPPYSDSLTTSKPRQDGSPELLGGELPATPSRDVKDPRSPPQKGSSPIIRNIFDFL